MRDIDPKVQGREFSTMNSALNSSAQQSHAVELCSWVDMYIQLYVPPHSCPSFIGSAGAYSCIHIYMCAYVHISSLKAHMGLESKGLNMCAPSYIFCVYAHGAKC